MSLRFLLAAAAGALFAATLPTQARAQSLPMAGPASVPVGVRVRLVLTDTLAELGNGRPIGVPARVEGTLVALEARSVEVRLASGRRFAFPADGVSSLEASVGAGRCRRSPRARAGCVAAGLLVGAAVGALVGGKIGADMTGDGEWGVVRRRWTRRGVVGGAAVALAVLPAYGRDQWAPVPGWPAGAGR